MDLAQLERRRDRHHERLLSGVSVSRLPASEKLPPHATARELDILRALAELRYACVRRIVRYLDSYDRGVQRTLEALRNKKLVAWFRWVDTTNAGNGLDPLATTPVYCLTTSGAERCILDRVIEDDTYTLTRGWRGKPVLHATMPHQLGIVDLMMDLRIAARRSPHYDIQWMVPDFVYEDIEGKSRVATIELLGTDNELRADLIACARAKNSERSVNFYVELERKNKGATEVTKKFDNYGVLFRTKDRRFNDGPPVLLYVVTSCVDPKDTDNRIKLVRKWVQNKPVAPAFRISSTDRIRDNAFGRVWQKADGSAWSIGE